MTAALAADPFAHGLAAFGRDRRRDGATLRDACESGLARIARLDPLVGAFEHVAGASARTEAAALDRAHDARIDLGPLMGITVAIKDLLAAEGMPVTAGSNLPVADAIGPEGAFVRRLRRLGCVLVGKTKTPEFALGGGRGGVSFVRGTPWNPWDASVHRIPGGSSSGSAVAVAAGLCGFAIGTDTSGSVRAPAALSGVFGLKTTVGRWPTDGMFRLSSTLDTVGLLTRSAADAALAFAAIDGVPPIRPLALRGLRFGRPEPAFWDGLEDAVGAACEAACAKLRDAGAEIVPVALPEAGETEAIFRELAPVELIAGLGRERLLKGRAQVDPIVWARAEPGFATPADRYVALLRRYRALCRIAAERMAGFDAWIAPTVAVQASPVPRREDLGRGPAPAVSMVRNTQSASLMGQCAASLPVHHLTGTTLPVGLQLIAAGGEDARLLAVALAVEDLLGTPGAPDLAPFLARAAP